MTLLYLSGHMAVFPFFKKMFLFVYQSCFLVFVVQNAGAVIGKGGKNIKALRTDVSKQIKCLQTIMRKKV